MVERQQHDIPQQFPASLDRDIDGEPIYRRNPPTRIAREIVGVFREAPFPFVQEIVIVTAKIIRDILPPKRRNRS